MSIVGSEQWMYSAGAEFYDFPIEQSLRFEDGDSAYLSRTPASAGNRKTWTWSGWVKKSFSSTTDTVLFSANNGGNQWFLIGFSGGNAGIDVDWYNGSTRLARKFSTAVFRDVSAWYNVVVAVDTTDATAELYLRSKGGWSPTNTVEEREVGSEEEEDRSAVEEIMTRLGKNTPDEHEDNG